MHDDFEEFIELLQFANVVGVTAPIIGLAGYRRTKAAAGRAKDLADLALLEEILGESRTK